MQQSIRYRGLSLTPDEMAVENGALSLCGNLELHDGALRPSFVSGTHLAHSLTVDGKVAKLLYIHETGNYRHLIAICSSSIYWFMQDGTIGSSSPIKSFDYESTVLSINSIGNTLIIVATDGIHYAMWKDGSYEYKGQKPPFINITFSITKGNVPEDYSSGGLDDVQGSEAGFYSAYQQTTMSCSDAFNTVDIGRSGTIKPGIKVANIKEEKQSDITQSVYALVNRTNHLISSHGRFYANFFIRYCYRMFDGSMIMHSAPIFIPVQVPDSYLVFPQNAYYDITQGANKLCFDEKATIMRKDADGKDCQFTINHLTFVYCPRNVELKYTINDSTMYELQEWKDVIKSVDIFVTPPVLNIDTAEKITDLEYIKDTYGLGYGRISWTAKTGTKMFYETRISFPGLSDEAFKQKMMNPSFFKICSLNVEDLKKAVNEPLPIDKGVLLQLSTQEQMKDDYKTHNHLFAKGGYVYNHRLNLFGVKEQLFAGFSGRNLFPISDEPKSLVFADENYLQIKKIIVELETTSGTKIVESEISYKEIELKFLINASKFYPDSKAIRMIIFAGDSIYAFPLTECSELNGAIFIGSFTGDENPSDYLLSSYEYTVDDMVDLSNKIYTSESDNAFYFPVKGINTVGIGTILGIASTTRALSQGQFGQYPLMAFSTDGIWALDVSSSGTYSSIHPISREVCSNQKAITQLDQSVAFATNRSFSRVAESQVVSMSDVLDGPGFSIVNNMGKFFNFFIDEEGDDDETKAVKSQMRQLIDFTSSPIDFFQSCQVIYDYKNSRLFCLDVGQDTKAANGDTVALCYSIRDEAWSTFLIKNVLTALNSYPHPYIQYRDGSVIVLDKGYDYSEDTEYHGIIVTRTLKFDEDNAPDAITGYIHSLTSDSVPVMWLYGSNDNQHWHYVGRVGGMKSSYMASHSYRFFRIAMYLKMKSMQQYFATRLEVIRRFNKF